MSRTRFIYFLSAIVLIIGCFALNTSYSLFVDNDTSSAIEAVVPRIDEQVTLSLSSVEVEGTKEYLIKQTITNNNSIPVGFRISATSDSTTYQVQSTKYETDTITKEDGTEEKIYTNYYSYGTVEANTSKDIYLKVSNTSEDTSNIAMINFSLESDYATLKMNTEEYLANANIDNQTQYEIVLGDLPYSDNPETLTYKVIKRQLDRDDSSNSSGVGSLFSETTNKITLPIESSFNVPTLTTVTGVETEEVGLYQAEDDYGTSYFYRGANDYNYVDFAGFTWRIVRINGDGSIRLILDGTLDLVKHKEENKYVYENESLYSLDTNGKVVFNYGYDASQVGYMYGEYDLESTNYDEAHANINDSIIKKYIDTFYEEYLLNYQEDYLADALFCADKTRADGYTDTGYGNLLRKNSFFRAYDRLVNNSNSFPTLRCADKNDIIDTDLTDEQLAYSRYTSKIDLTTFTNRDVQINNDLNYPIGLLNADELVFAGGYYYKVNNDYYLYDGYEYDVQSLYNEWYLMTPSSYIPKKETNYIFISKIDDNSLVWNGTLGEGGIGMNTNGELGVRPVINLKSTLLWESGDGTQDNPYTVKLS